MHKMLNMLIGYENQVTYDLLVSLCAYMLQKQQLICQIKFLQNHIYQTLILFGSKKGIKKQRKKKRKKGIKKRKEKKKRKANEKKEDKKKIKKEKQKK